MSIFMQICIEGYVRRYCKATKYFCLVSKNVYIFYIMMKISLRTICIIGDVKLQYN